MTLHQIEKLDIYVDCDGIKMESQTFHRFLIHHNISAAANLAVQILQLH
jgi:hypothetical protein